MEEEEIELGFDPSQDRVLGVFGDIVHVELEMEQVVLLVDIDDYKDSWSKWLQGKKEYCESYNHYCGVMGYLPVTRHAKQDYKIIVNVWRESIEEMVPVEYDVYYAVQLEKPEFEHG